MKHYLSVFPPLVFLEICLFILAFAVFSAFPAYAQPAARSSLASSQESAAQTCAQPPQNVNLMALSDAQLRLYGLPQHNVLESNPAQWSAVLAHAKHHDCASSPGTVAEENLPAASDVAVSYSPVWAGYVATGTRGTYRQAFVNFTIPTATHPDNSNVSFWAGVGGDIPSPFGLVQAGVTVSVTSSGAQTNTAWWEIVGTPANPLPHNFSFAVRRGDSISVEVDSNLNGDGYDYYYVGDNTTGAYGTHTETDYFSDSATGECIGEKHAGPPVADFGTEHLNGCIIGTNSGQKSIGNWNPNLREDVVTTNGQSSGKKLICTGSISGGELFSVYWENSISAC